MNNNSQLEKLLFLNDNLKNVWEDTFVKQIELLLNKKYVMFLNDEFFHIECTYNNERVQFKIILKANNESFVYPIEVVFLKENNILMPNDEIAFILLDYLDMYWNEYFNDNRDTYVPIDWSMYEFENIKFVMRGVIRNLYAENMANSLFSECGHGEHSIYSISEDL